MAGRQPGSGHGMRYFISEDPNISSPMVPNGAKHFACEARHRGPVFHERMEGQRFRDFECGRYRPDCGGRSRAIGVLLMKHSLPLPSLARRRSLSAVLACSEERNCPPDYPVPAHCSARFSRAVMYRSSGRREATTRSSRSIALIACRVSPFRLDAQHYSARARRGNNL